MKKTILFLATTFFFVETFSQQSKIININLGGNGNNITPSNTPNQHLNGYLKKVDNGSDSIIEQSTNKFYTDNRARASITVRTNGNSGPADYINGIINIPVYNSTVNTITEADYFLSNFGSTANSGTTRVSAKATLQGIDSVVNNSTLPVVKVAIQGGSIFKEGGIPLGRANIVVDAYDLDKAGRTELPKFIGSTPHTTGWTLTGSNTYQKSIAHSVSTGSTTTLGTYSYIFVIAVDTVLEKTQPLTARHYLHYVSSVAAVDTTADSYFCPVSAPATSPTLISIHTPDGVSPNNNSKYRYEVVTKGNVFAFPGGARPYGNGLKVSNISAIDYGEGIGFIGNINSGTDSNYLSYNYFQGSAIHGAVLGNNSIVDGCTFAQGDYKIPSQIAVVFYKDSGALNGTNMVKNSIFLDNGADIYTHSAGSPPINKKITSFNNYFFNTTDIVIGALQADTIDFDNCYVDGAGRVITTSTKESFIRNSIMLNTDRLTFNTKKLTIDNSLWLSPKTAATAFIFGSGDGDKAIITNSIFHTKNKILSGGGGGVIFNNADTSTRINAQHNIFIIDGAYDTYMDFAHCNTWAGAGTGPDIWDWNVYIRVRGIPRWLVSNSATNGGVDYINGSFDTWKIQSGQDSHSIFIDLTLYESNLKRIFVDPDNGNYHLTDSPQADSIRALFAGMTTPLGMFVAKPTKEQAYYATKSHKMLPVIQLMSVNGNSFGNYTPVERMTTTERNVTYPSKGRHVFDTTINKEYTGDGISWNALW